MNIKNIAYFSYLARKICISAALEKAGVQFQFAELTPTMTTTFYQN